MKIPMPRFIMACVGSGLLTVSQFGVKPAVEFELNQRLSAVDVGYTQSCVSALGLLSLLLVGRASDIVGRKFLMLALVTLLLSAFLYMTISPLPPVSEDGHEDLTPFDAVVMPMVAVLVVIGVANMSGSVLAKALVTDATAPLLTDSAAQTAAAKDRNKLFNRLLLAQSGTLGFLAPKFIKRVKASHGLSGLFQTLCVASGGVMLVIAALPENESESPKQKTESEGRETVPPLSAVLAEVRGNPTLATMFLIRFLHCLSAHLILSLMPRFVSDALSMGSAGLMDLFSHIGAIFTVVQVMQPIVLAKVTSRTSFVVGMVLVALGRLLFVATVTDFDSCIRCYVVILTGIGMYLPAYNSMVGLSAPDNMRGTILSLSASTESLSLIVMPIVGGYVVGEFGIWMPFRVSAAISVLNGVVAVMFYFFTSKSSLKPKGDDKKKQQ